MMLSSNVATANHTLPTQERMCLMESILNEMQLAVDHDQVPVFEPGVVDKIAKRAVDGCLRPVPISQ